MGAAAAVERGPGAELGVPGRQVPQPAPQRARHYPPEQRPVPDLGILLLRLEQ